VAFLLNVSNVLGSGRWRHRMRMEPALGARSASRDHERGRTAPPARLTVDSNAATAVVRPAAVTDRYRCIGDLGRSSPKWLHMPGAKACRNIEIDVSGQSLLVRLFVTAGTHAVAGCCSTGCWSSQSLTTLCATKTLLGGKAPRPSGPSHR